MNAHCAGKEIQVKLNGHPWVYAVGVQNPHPFTGDDAVVTKIDTFDGHVVIEFADGSSVTTSLSVAIIYCPPPVEEESNDSADTGSADDTGTDVSAASGQ